MDYRDIRLRTAKLKKEKGASSVVLLIMFFILMGVALIVAFMQWRNQKVRILQVQDSLAASVLAASVPEVYENTNGDIFIPESKVPYTFNLFKEALQINTMTQETAVNSNLFNPINEQDILANLTVKDYRVYSVQSNAVGTKTIHEYRVDPETGLIVWMTTHDYRDEEDPAVVKTPNGKPIVWTTIYAKVNIDIQTPALKIFLGENASGVNMDIEKVSAIVKDTMVKVVAHDWINPEDYSNKEVLATKTFKFNETVTDIENFLNEVAATKLPYRQGYRFVGWDKGASQIQALIDNGNAIIDIYAVFAEDGVEHHTLKVFDGEDYYTVRLKPGEDVSYTAKNIPGKLFLYWSYDREGSTLASNDKNIVFVMPDHDVVLWAIYNHTDVGSIAELITDVLPTETGFQAKTKWYVKDDTKRTIECGYLLALDPAHLDYNHELVIQAGAETGHVNVGNVVTDISFYNDKDITVYGRAYLKLEDRASGAVEIIYTDPVEIFYDAPDAEKYIVYVGGIKVTDANANDIFASDPSKGNSGLATFDLYTRELTLNAVDIVGNYTLPSNSKNYGIYTNSHLTINLIGDNFVDGNILNDDGGVLVINDVSPAYVNAEANISVDGAIENNVINNAKINNAVIAGTITNNKIIAGGSYNQLQNTKEGTVTGGVFKGITVNNGDIRGGLYTGTTTNNAGAVIRGGDITGAVINAGVITEDTMTTPTISGKVTNTNAISGGMFTGEVVSTGHIASGQFTGTVANGGSITGGSFDCEPGNVVNGATIDGVAKPGVISGGTFVSLVINEKTGSIKGGTFKDFVVNREGAIEEISKLHKITAINSHIDCGYTLGGTETLWAQPGKLVSAIEDLGELAFNNWTAEGIVVSDVMLNTSPLGFYMPSNDVIVKANGAWVAIFDGNGGSNGGTIVRNVGEKLGTLPTSYRIGYAFTGWYTQPEGGTKISENTLMPDNTVTYYAHWDALPFTATFESNGGSVASPSTITKVAGEALGTLPTTTRTGYIFDAWYTAVTGGERIYSTTQMPANGATYYAHWTPIKYFVEFDANGGAGLQMSQQEFTYDEARKLAKNEYSKTGYAFAGWNTKADGSGTTYTDEQEVKNLTDINEEIISLYAQWGAQSFNITYNLNGGTIATPNPANYSPETPTFTLNNPTKAGYEFVGWTGSNGTVPQQTVTIAQGTVGVLEYTANWMRTPIVVTYDSTSGEFAGNATGLYENKVKYTENIVLEGEYIQPTNAYGEFLGWYTDKNYTAGTEFNPATDPVKYDTDIRVYAKWEYKNLVFAYIDGVNGNDANSGLTPDEPIKTLAEAYERLSGGGSLYVVDTITINNMTAISNNTYSDAGGSVVTSGDVNIYRYARPNNYAAYRGHNRESNLNALLSISNGATVAIQNLVFDGVGASRYETMSTSVQASAPILRNSGSVTIEGATFKNNNSTSQGGAIYNEGIMLFTGHIYNSQATLGSGIYQAGTLTIKGNTMLHDNCDIYLHADETLVNISAALTDTNGNPLSATTKVARITPNSYRLGRTVARVDYSGTMADALYQNFTLTPNGSFELRPGNYIDDSLNILDSDIVISQKFTVTYHETVYDSGNP